MASPQATLHTRFGHLPLSFIENAGQIDPQVQFHTRAPGYSLHFGPSHFTLVAQASVNGHAGPDVGSAGEQHSVATDLLSAAPSSMGTGALTSTAATVRRDVVDLTFPGARADVHPVGGERLPGVANFYLGADLQHWRTAVPTYGALHYPELYPGIDLIYRGGTASLKSEWLVAPGADPTAIRLAYGGDVVALSLDASGALHITLPMGELIDTAPEVYQEVAGSRRVVASRYVLHGEREVGFALGAYDPTLPLVIDPALLYSTYLGGTGIDQGTGIAVDATGSAYVTGRATAGFPLQNAAQPTFGGNFDAFVAKLTPDGSALVYSTYVGGGGADEAYAIAVDPAGNAYITGSTQSQFPTTAGAAQTTFGGGSIGLGIDAFVTKLTATGAIGYSTYLGGVGDDLGYGIAVDAQGNVFVAGSTSGAYLGNTFPTTAGVFQPQYAPGLGTDAFVTKLNAQGSALVYSTYLGGTGADIAYAITIDGSGNAYVTGSTSSPGTGTGPFPTTPGVYQATRGGGLNAVTDVFVTKLNPTATALVYSTYLGGSGTDEGRGIAVDGAGNAYVTGSTSGSFPTQNAVQATYGGGATTAPSDAFVTKLNPTATALVYSTYLGGPANDGGMGIAVDSASNAYVTGFAGDGFPTTPGTPQPTYGGGVRDAFVLELNPAGSSLLYSTYLGGSGSDRGAAIAIDAAGNAYVTGNTQGNFPVTPGAYQTTFKSGPTSNPIDAFVAKIGNAGGAVPTSTATAPAAPTATQTGVPAATSTATPSATATALSATATATSVPATSTVPVGATATATGAPPSATATATVPAGATATATPASGGLGQLRFINPVRVVDTRATAGGIVTTGFTSNGAPIAAGQLTPNQIARFKVAGQTFSGFPFPNDVTGLLMNVTTIQGSGSGGFVTVFPGDQAAVPNASTVNPSTPIAFNFWETGIPTVGPNAGTFAVFSTNALDIAIDVVGFYSPANPNTVGNLRFVPPQRVVDTRASAGAITTTGFGPGGCTPITPGPIQAGTTRRFQIGGCTFSGTSFPTDVRGILANVTIVQDAPSGGFVTVFPGDQAAVPNASTVNPSTPIAFNFWATGVPSNGVPNSGQIAVFSTNTLDVIIDVVGYYAPSNTVGSAGVVGEQQFINPVRAVDTRPSEGGITTTGFEPGACIPITPGPLTAGQIRRFQINGCTFSGQSFGTDVKGVLANVTIVQPSGPSGGFVTVFPGSLSAPPNASTVNPVTGIDANFWATGIPLAPESNPGTIGAFSTNTLDLIVDVVAYFR